jgi:phosphatidylserine/phosphatidylglycerophosphate/cardiolipin synthase-like enzyme
MRSKVRLLSWFSACALVAACSGSAGSGNGEPEDGGNPQGGPDGGTPVADGSLPPGVDGGAGTPDGHAPPPHDGSTPGINITTSPVQLIVEPSDDADALLTAMKAAKKSIHMTMYQLDDSRFISALTSAHSSGLEVKVILQQTFPTGGNNNQSAYNTLTSAGVSVVWASTTFSLTHEKCVILDGATAWIMTMNLNSSSPSSNREYLAIDTVAGDVQEAESIFAADFAHSPIVPGGNLVVAPVNARQLIVALIQEAKTKIDVEGEELSDTSVVSALVAAQGAGIPVRIVLASTTPSSSQQTAVTQLKAAGVKVVSTSNPYIHAKALVTDGTRAYVGSANFTAGSLAYNRELGVITADATALGQLETTIGTDFSHGTAL